MTTKTPKDWRTTLLTAGQWAWANRDRLRAAVQSEPVQELLRHPQAQKLLNNPRLRQTINDPEIQRLLHSPEVQQWLSGTSGSPQPAPTTDSAKPGFYPPYTGETRRLG
ncbi:MAG: hypothetical protein AB4911_14250 [Oscillochloridaceae bacterium umkhey_bin13]